jgi:stearoyl-CoA desaturase (delta-9 desaturase)
VFFTGVSALGLVLCGVFYAVRVFGVTAGYHRYFSHRAYKTSRAFQFVLACLGCSACQKGPLWWVGHHRYHHLHSDTPSDLHSPNISGLWRAHVGWIISHDHDVTNWQAVQDWSRYPELRWLNRHHWVPGLGVALLCLLIGGWTGLVWGFFVSTVLVYHATFTINSLSHLIGRQRYATADASRNNLFLALLTFGEGWHNNHHRYQSSANQGFFWWEIDVSYYLIALLGVVGLVWDIRKPPRAVLEESGNVVSPTSEPGSGDEGECATDSKGDGEAHGQRPNTPTHIREIPCTTNPGRLGSPLGLTLTKST